MNLQKLQFKLELPLNPLVGGPPPCLTLFLNLHIC